MIKLAGITALAILLLIGNAAAVVMQECLDRDYVSGDADYIVEGTIEKVESKLVEEESGFNGQSVFTYNDLKIEKYIKGNPLKQNRIQIVTRGGTAGGVSQWSEDEPTFNEGTMVRVYLRETKGNFSLVCAEYGVEEILKPDLMAGAPVEIWNRTFGGVGLGKAYSVQQTSDGGFILAGETGLFGAEETYAWLIKTDSHGNEMWNRIFGKRSSRAAKSVMQASDGGYIFISNNMLTKTDENGKYLWSKEFSGIGNSVINSVRQTKDGDYILASDTVLIKVDDKGNILWKKAFEKLAGGRINSVQQTSDGGYIIVWNKIKYEAEDTWLFKIDSDGNEQWSRTLGGKSSDYAYYVQQTADGGYVITGETRSYGSGDFDAWLIKTDASGIEQWNKTFGGIFRDSTYFVQQTPDGGFILAGSRSYRSYGYEAWLIKTDGSGNLQWIKPFRGSGIGSVYSVYMTKDNGFALAGYTSSYLGADSYAWLIKVGGEPTGTAKTAKSAYNRTPVGDLILNTSVFLTFSDYRSGWEYARNVTMLKEGYSVFLDSVRFYEEAPWIRIANFSIHKNGEVVKNLHAKAGDVFYYNKTIDGKEYRIIESKVDGFFVNSHIMVRLKPLYQYSDGEPVIEPEIKTTVGPPSADISVLEEWNRTFGRMRWTKESYTVKRTSDGGYITAGSINPFGTGLDAFLIKSDSNGSELWKRTFGGKEDDEVFSVIETGDGYILAGKTGSYGMGYFDAWLIKTDASGNERWNRTFGGAEGNYAYADTANSVRKTRDGGYILAGKTGSYGAGFFDVWLIKTDADGIEEWNRTFGGRGDEEAYSVQLREDGGYIIAGSTDIGNGKHPWLIRTDANGIEKWNSTFVGLEYDVLPLNNVFRVASEPDDSYITAGAATIAANSTDHKVNPVEKAAGFEMVLAIIAILACRCCSCRGKP